MKSHLLIVEDDSSVARVIADLLRQHGHAADVVTDGQAGLRALADFKYDLVVLDLMLPRLSGLDLCRAARSRGFTGAILMLTAKSQVTDRVQGLEGGADDYLVKPYDPDELVARVNALLRRLHRQDLAPMPQLSFGSFHADFQAGRFTRGKEPVCLTAKETDLLRLLAQHAGETLTRDEILAQVWPEQPHITIRTVDVHIAWLRQKVEDRAELPRHIVTVRGQGYRFEK
jgi:two-component system alkaline phosphatase synthesis response regulator PhoP